MTVRAKMRLISVEMTEGGRAHLHFECQYDQTIPEDMKFQKATPSGHIKMTVDNPAAVEQFKRPGATYYVDFNLVE